MEFNVETIAKRKILVTVMEGMKNDNERAKSISKDMNESINELGKTNCYVEIITEGNKAMPVIEMMKINDENLEREAGIEVHGIEKSVDTIDKYTKPVAAIEEVKNDDERAKNISKDESINEPVVTEGNKAVNVIKEMKIGGENPKKINVKNALIEETTKERFRKINIKDDGNCLFRCFSKNLYGTEERHAEVRKEVVTYTVVNWQTKWLCLQSTC